MLSNIGFIALGFAIASFSVFVVLGAGFIRSLVRDLNTAEDQLVEHESVKNELSALRYEFDLSDTAHLERIGEVREELHSLQLVILRMAKQLEERSLIEAPALYKEPVREDQETYW